MKILHIKINEIEHRPLMKGMDLYFDEQNADFINANCFIGINGSGKSQLLETIAEIFLYVDNFYRETNRNLISIAPILFEITYSLTINNKIFKVEISQTIKKGKAPKVTVVDDQGNFVDVLDDDVENYLPQKVIGYTSGENETISNPFHTYYDHYAGYVANKALHGLKGKDYEPRFYFMDYNTNLGIAISNLIFDNVQGLNEITSELKIKKIKSFQIVLQTKQPAAPGVVSYKGETGVALTEELLEWRDFLKKCATCYDYIEKDEKYIFDFLNIDSTREAIKHYFKTPYKLYTALYKFEILNNLIIDKATRAGIRKQRTQRKLSRKMPEVPDKDKVMRYSELKLELLNDQVVDYLNLSDGEHQFFNIFGTIIMVNQPNSLFLLDEPETHFNPKWRRLFISKLKSLTEHRKQDLFITSHSPFIVSDSKRESVYIFNRVSKDKVEVTNPSQETFGASFSHILKMAFSMDEINSEEGSNFIEKLLKSNDIQEIENGIDVIGESAQLLTLYRRLDMLKKG
ncbi:restriction system-associated AAA family ATPase [Mucilaginibacter sp.]|uniref:restriction system-associated AAA family ATPase n=1 Tax=Mucilaginibacter sp. TaxID=1882438 RepID=UPI003D143CA2